MLTHRPATYGSDLDGRLTVAPDYRYEWDRLGRLTTVRPPSGGSVIATYTYDPLDRLRMIDYGGPTRTRFRYTGRTTSVAQWIDDQPGTVIRNVANGWTGERLADWTWQVLCFDAWRRGGSRTPTDRPARQILCSRYV